MNQKQYHALKNQYQRRESTSPLAYSNRNRHRHDQKNGEYLPYSLFFRLRIIVCILLFFSFLFADKFVLKGNETQKLYETMAKNTTGEEWKNYAIDAFATVKESLEEKEISE